MLNNQMKMTQNRENTKMSEAIHILETSINKGYSVLINNLTDSFQNLLTTTVSNADSFGESIRKDISELKSRLYETQVINNSDESYEGDIIYPIAILNSIRNNIKAGDSSAVNSSEAVCVEKNDS